MKFNQNLTITRTNYIARERLRAISVLEAHGWKAAAEAFEVGRSILYLWRKDYSSAGKNAAALRPKSTRPHHTRRMEIDPQVFEFISDIRRRYPRIGKSKIKPLLNEYCLRQGITPIAEATIGKVIKRNNLFFPQTVRKRAGKRRNRISSRIKAVVPGELVQIDALVRFEDGVRFYILTAVDQFCRFSFAFSYKTLSSRTALDFFHRLERAAPFAIQAVKTDNGAEFLGEFDQYLAQKTIPHYFTYPRTPQSNAYVERFNRTLQEEFVEYHLDLIDDLTQFNGKLIDYLLFFNGVRPHQALAQIAPLGYLVKNQFQSNMSVSHTGY